MKHLHGDVVDAIFFGDEADGPQVVVDFLGENFEVIAARCVDVGFDLPLRSVQVDVKRHSFTYLINSK